MHRSHTVHAGRKLLHTQAPQAACPGTPATCRGVGRPGAWGVAAAGTVNTAQASQAQADWSVARAPVPLRVPA